MRRLLLVALLAGCVPQRPTVVPPERPPPTIADVRAAAAARPGDPAVMRVLASWELLADGGDAQRVRPAVDAALRLAPDDPVLHLVSAMEHEQRGRLEEAYVEHLLAIDAARGANDPLAPAVAELSIGWLGSLRDGVRDWATRTDAAMALLLAAPGGIGLPARDEAAALAADLAYRRGDLAAVRRLTAQANCVTRWRVAGPFGPYDLLGLDAPVAAEGPGRLADEYDLGPARGTRPTRVIETRGCGANLGGPIAGGGATVAETAIEIREGGRYVLALETPNSAKLLVDGTVRAVVDARSTWQPRVTYHAVDLAPGAHEVEVVVVTRHPDPYLGLIVERTGTGAERGIDPPEPGDPFQTWLRAMLLQARGLRVEARETLRAFETSAPTATSLIARADVALGDPLLPQTERRDRARALLRRAAAADPQAWYPAFELAVLDERGVEAIAAMREVAARWPTMAQMHLTLAEMLRERGSAAEADEAIRRAREVAPESCPAIAAESAALRDLGRIAEANRLVDLLMRCDMRSDARLERAMRQRRWDEAEREIDRLASLEPVQAQIEFVGARLEVARARGDDAAVQRLMETIAREDPRSSAPALDAADRALAQERRDAAIHAIDVALARDPAAMAELRGVRRTIAGEDEMDRWRRDGVEIIRAFEASGRRYDDPQVLVFDYMVVRLHADGSSTELIHQIHRIQSEEAVDAHGQVDVDGRVLNVRTIKADHRIVEPDEIAGMDQISLTGLQIGDYVETELVRERGAPRNGAYRTVRWSFQAFDRPFDFSQLLVVAPQGMPISVERRGGAPAAAERADGDVRVYDFTMRQVRSRVREPRAVTATEIIPSVVVGVNATWPSIIEALRDALADKDLPDPAHERLVLEILGAAVRAPVEDRVRRLQAWIVDNIEASENLFDPVAPMVTARQGHRTRVLRYLLRLAGVPSDLVLVRPFGSVEPSEVSDPSLYSTVMLRVAREGEPLWIWVDRGTPFGWIPSSLRGMDALPIVAGEGPVRVPDAPVETERRQIALDVTVREDGSARVRVVERHVGASAASWRNGLENMPQAEIPRRFQEGYVTNLAAGAQLRGLRIEGRESPDAPIVLRYTLDVPALARRAAGRQLVPILIPNGAAPTFASLPIRTTAQLLGGYVVDVRMRVRAEAGRIEAPSDVSLEGPNGARFQMRARRDRDSVTVSRRLILPRMRVDPEGYPALTEFARATDEAERRELVITPR